MKEVTLVLLLWIVTVCVEATWLPGAKEKFTGLGLAVRIPAVPETLSVMLTVSALALLEVANWMPATLLPDAGAPAPTDSVIVSGVLVPLTLVICSQVAPNVVYVTGVTPAEEVIMIC